jgi:hypothetical protein
MLVTSAMRSHASTRWKAYLTPSATQPGGASAQRRESSESR